MHTVLEYLENDAIDWFSAEAILSFSYLNLFSWQASPEDRRRFSCRYAALLIHCQSQCFLTIGSEAVWLEAVCARLVIARACPCRVHHLLLSLTGCVRN